MQGLFGPLWWLWIVAPLFTAFVYLLSNRPDDRRAREIARWRKGFGPHLADDEAEPDGRRRRPPRQAQGLPGPLARGFGKVGDGQPLGFYELLPRVAFLAIAEAGSADSSDYQAVVARLDEKAPTFTVKPTPIVEGVLQPGLGIEFKKDPDFSDAFVVEGVNDAPATLKAIRRWLSTPIRDALMDVPEVYLWVDGATLVVAYYGAAGEDELNRLVLAADTIFAEHGAAGGASLFGEDDDEEDDEDDAPSRSPAPAPAPAKA
ncbi:MAG TPA: hypothetical protein VGM56_22345 [Byssovorax sp.]|jgi:hypothetical protein